MLIRYPPPLWQLECINQSRDTFAHPGYMTKMEIKTHLLIQRWETKTTNLEESK